MSDPLGKRFLKSFLKNNDFSVLRKFGISELDFQEDAKTAYDFIIKYFTEYEALPTVLAVEEACLVSFEIDVDPVEFIADRLKHRTLTKHVADKLRVATEKLVGGDPKSAITILRAFADEAVTDDSELVTFVKNAKDRFDAYESPTKPARGILTPWPNLDEAINGFCEGQFIVIAAQANTGKTWSLCVCADKCLQQNKRVLFVSLEMATERILQRLDAIHFKIPFGDLRRASVDIDKQFEWRKKVKEADLADSITGDIILADKKVARRVIDVVSLIKQYKPEIVFIDGGYRFEGRDSKKEGSWENSLQIITEIQIYSERTNIPWVVTTQLGDANSSWGKKKKGERLTGGKVRYAKEWFIHPDALIELYQDEDLRLIKTQEIHLMKLRDADAVPYESFAINWDLHNMNFNQIDEGDAGVDDIGPMGEIKF